MKNMSAVKIGSVILLGVFLFFSCNGKVTTRSKQTNFQFTINGVLVKDTSLGKDLIYFKVLRDSLDFDSALVKVGTDTVKSSGSGTYSKQATKLFNYGQNITIVISSAKDNFSLSTSILMPGSFQITSINYDSVTYNETTDITMNFSLSSGASGYFKSIVQPDGKNGDTETIPSGQFGYTSIPRNSFLDEYDNYVTGWYKIYIVSYNSSFLAYPGMTYYVPNGLPSNNISGANGIICAGVVAASHSIKAR